MLEDAGGCLRMLEGAKEFPLLQISIVPGVTYIVGSRDAIASKNI